MNTDMEYGTWLFLVAYNVESQGRFFPPNRFDELQNYLHFLFEDDFTPQEAVEFLINE